MRYNKDKDMYFFTPEEKAEAHNISVIDYLQRNYGFTFKRDGNGFRCREHNSLFIHSDEKSWYWNSHGFGGGDVVEFVRKYENKSYADALKTVLNPTVTDNPINYSKAPENVSESEKRELLLPVKKNGKYSRVYAYLTKSRCIDPSIVTTLLHKKFIYEDEHSNCVFVGYNKDGFPAYASVRTTLTDRQFRRDALGSDKSNGFYLKGFDKSKLYVFEAPIDLLSHATLANINSGNPREWLKSTRLSLGGVSDKALERFCNDYSDVKEIVFCLDNDSAGIEATEKYMRKYADKGYTVSSQPSAFKDYNEDLKYFVKNCKAVTPKM